MLALAVVLAVGPEGPTAEDIMAKVAENQQRAHEARARYVYRQDVLGRLIRNGGKIAREEKRVYTVMPEAQGVRKELTSFEGRYQKGGKYFEYKEKGYQYKDVDIDGALLGDMVDDLVGDPHSGSRSAHIKIDVNDHALDNHLSHDSSGDDIKKDLFPLRKDKLDQYQFQLLETKTYRGRQVYRIEFRPKDKNDFGWKGEALIDAEEYEPVSIWTRLSRGIPVAVKVLLGTDVKQLGFSVEYARVAPGLWFPVSYGTEFHIRAVFFYARTITLSLKSSDFRATDVQSSVSYQVQ
jgi:hypothetical protein